MELCRGVHLLIKYFATCLFNLLMESKLGPGIEASHGEGIFGSRACAAWSSQKEGGETVRGKSPDGVVWLVWVWARVPNGEVQRVLISSSCYFVVVVYA